MINTENSKIITDSVFFCCESDLDYSFWFLCKKFGN